THLPQIRAIHLEHIVYGRLHPCDGRRHVVTRLSRGLALLRQYGAVHPYPSVVARGKRLPYYLGGWQVRNLRRHELASVSAHPCVHGLTFGAFLRQDGHGVRSFRNTCHATVTVTDLERVVAGNADHCVAEPGYHPLLGRQERTALRLRLTSDGGWRYRIDERSVLIVVKKADVPRLVR